MAPSPRLSCRLFGAPGLRLLSVGLALGLAVPAAALPTIVTSTTSTVALDLPAVTPIFVPTARYPCFRQPALLAVGAYLAYHNMMHTAQRHGVHAYVRVQVHAHVHVRVHVPAVHCMCMPIPTGHVHV